MAAQQSKRKGMTFAEYQREQRSRTEGSQNMSLINELKNLNTERASLDELVALSAGAKSLSAEYTAQTLPEPEWLSDARRTLATEIKRQVNDRLTMELREIEQAEQQLMTAAEKREKLAARKAELQAKLGQPA